MSQIFISAIVQGEASGLYLGKKREADLLILPPGSVSPRGQLVTDPHPYPKYWFEEIIFYSGDREGEKRRTSR
jgi:hypothetical protein